MPRSTIEQGGPDRHRHLRCRRVVAGSIAALTVAAGLTQAAGAESSQARHHASDKAPIVVGAISFISGGSIFGASNEGAQAYFRYVNAHGGVDGRKIAYTALDDAASPATAGQDARQLIAKGAVALVGGESLLECGVNAATYAKAGIIDAPQGIDSGCFSSPNVAPINYGPFIALDVDLLWAKQALHAKRLCALVPGTPGLPQGYAKAVAKFEKDTGTKLALYDNSMTPTTSDYMPYAIKVKDAHCQFVYVTTQQAQSVAFVNDLAAQGVQGVNVMFPQPDYTPAFAKAIPQTNPGVLVDNEYTPYTETGNPAVRRFISIEQRYGGSVSDGGEGGYAAASLFVKVLRTIKGPITRASVTAAYRRARNMKVPLLGTAWSFGHQRSGTSYSDHFLRLENHKWVALTSTRGFTVPSDKTA